MTDEQRKAYKHQLRVLQAAKAAMKADRKVEIRAEKNSRRSHMGPDYTHELG